MHQPRGMLGNRWTLKRWAEQGRLLGTNILGTFGPNRVHPEAHERIVKDVHVYTYGQTRGEEGAGFSRTPLSVKHAITQLSNTFTRHL